MKLALLISETDGAETLDTLTRPCVVPGPVTDHAQFPVFAVDAASVVQDDPPYRDSSILTKPVTLVDVQVMLWTLPIAQVS